MAMVHAVSKHGSLVTHGDAGFPTGERWFTAKRGKERPGAVGFPVSGEHKGGAALAGEVVERGLSCRDGPVKNTGVPREMKGDRGKH